MDGELQVKARRESFIPFDYSKSHKMFLFDLIIIWNANRIAHKKMKIIVFFSTFKSEEISENYFLCICARYCDFQFRFRYVRGEKENQKVVIEFVDYINLYLFFGFLLWWIMKFVLEPNDKQNFFFSIRTASIKFYLRPNIELSIYNHDLTVSRFQW